MKNYMKIIAVIDKDLTPNSLDTNDGQISRWGGGGDVEVLNWQAQTHTCTNVIKIAEYIWVNNHVQFLEVY